MDGKLSRLHYQKQLKLAESFYIADARKDAEDIVNVSRKHSSALHFATVMDIALRTKLQIIAYNYFGVGII